MAAEVRRLHEGPASDEQPAGAGLVDIELHSPGAAERVLGRVKEALLTVLAMTEAQLSHGETSGLPAWLTASFAPPIERDTDEWRAWLDALPAPDRDRVDLFGAWRGRDWLWYFLPERREWHWWDGHVVSADEARITIQVQGWPYPWGALGWLISCAGASDVVNLG